MMYSVTISMKLRVTRIVKKKTPRLLWNPMVHCNDHNSPPMDPMRDHLNTDHVLAVFRIYIKFNIILQSTSSLPSDILVSD
jgi:hypothetical protein